MTLGGQTEPKCVGRLVKRDPTYSELSWILIGWVGDLTHHPVWGDQRQLPAGLDSDGEGCAN